MLIYDIYIDLGFYNYKIFEVYNFMDDKIKGYIKPELSMMIRNYLRLLKK